jgi:hypothetical protein
MKFHLLSTPVYFSGAISAFHVGMFHGRASRGGIMPTYRDYRLAFPLDRPLRLKKNVFNLAAIFRPEGELVVIDTVREVLQQFTSLRFEPVEFAHVFSVPYQAADFSFRQSLPPGKSDEWTLDAHPHDASLMRDLHPYFRLCAPPIRELADLAAAVREVEVVLQEDAFEETVSYPVSPELLERYPAYNCGELVLSDVVFTAIAPFIDWNYFRHAEGSV